jgi:tight adherence protein B
MTDIPTSLLFYIFVFVATFLAAEGALQLFAGQQRARQVKATRRLRKLAKRLQAPRADPDETLLRGEGPRLPLLDRLYAVVPGRRAVELRLYRAGVSMPPARFVGICLLATVIGVTTGLIFWPEQGLWMPLAFLGVLPWVQLSRMASKRMRRFEEQFPEALELLTRALRAGHSLIFAFQLIGEELAEPIGPEFGQLAQEIKLGQSLAAALANLTYRMNVGDLPYFCTAILIQRETGGNLAELLDSLGYVIRDRFKLFGKVRSLTAVGKATANILGIWPVLMVVGLMMVGADFVSMLWETPTGHILGGAALGLMVLGYVLSLRAAEIRV